MYQSKDSKIKILISQHISGGWAATYYDAVRLTDNAPITSWTRSKLTFHNTKEEAETFAHAAIAHYNKHHPVTLDTYSITYTDTPDHLDNSTFQAISLLAAVNEAHQTLPSNADIISAVRTT